VKHIKLISITLTLLLSAFVLLSCSSTEETTAADCEHKLTAVERKEATCTEDGWEEYEFCSKCDYTTLKKIAKLDHDEMKHDAKPATCTEDGWEAYVTCSRCEYTTYSAIPALNHDSITHKAQAATCSSIGWNEYVKCQRCDYTTYTEIPVQSHQFANYICTECGASEGDLWDKTEDISWYSPDKSEFAITTAEQFAGFSNLVNSGIDFKNKTIKLETNLNLNGNIWTPIGSDRYKFSGEFDGGNHTVSNYKIPVAIERQIGLFGGSNGIIRNVGVKDCTIDVSLVNEIYVGGILGYNDSGLVENCYFSGSIKSSANNTAYSGGLVAINSGDIINCYATGKVTAISTNTPEAYSGGLVAVNSGNISKCYTTNEVSADAITNARKYSVGGLIAINEGGTISDCHTSGSAEGWLNTGGLIAEAYSGNILNCYTSGVVKGIVNSGGIIGQNSGAIIEGCHSTATVECVSPIPNITAIGGIVGDNFRGNIKSCHSKSILKHPMGTSNGYVGGIAGYNCEAEIHNCYSDSKFDLKTTSSSFIGGIVGRNDGVISNCYSVDNINVSFTSSPCYVGGFVGYNYQGSISKCYSTCTITVNTSENNPNDKLYIALFVGFNTGIVEDSYSAGSITSPRIPKNSVVGEFVAENRNEITNCYRQNDTFFSLNNVTEKDKIQVKYIAAGTELPSNEIKTVKFHSDTLKWSTDVWNLKDGEHPTLKTQN